MLERTLVVETKAKEKAGDDFFKRKKKKSQHLDAIKELYFIAAHTQAWRTVRILRMAKGTVTNHRKTMVNKKRIQKMLVKKTPKPLCSKKEKWSIYVPLEFTEWELFENN